MIGDQVTFWPTVLIYYLDNNTPTAETSTNRVVISTASAITNIADLRHLERLRELREMIHSAKHRHRVRMKQCSAEMAKLGRATSSNRGLEVALPVRRQRIRQIHRLVSGRLGHRKGHLSACRRLRTSRRRRGLVDLSSD